MRNIFLIIFLLFASFANAANIPPNCVTSGYGLNYATATNSYGCVNFGGGGGVTSVALSLPSFITVSGSPVTTTGTLTGTLATQSANTLFAGPTTGSAAAPTFRAVVAADIPTLNQNTTGSAATLTTGRTIGITGDLTYTSPSFDGSSNVTAAGTLATVNANVGTFQGITLNAKGLATGATNQGYITGNQSITFMASGDATGTATGTTALSPALTLATVNTNVGSFGSSTAIPTITVNAKGLTTAVTTNAVIAPAGTLSGTTLNSTVINSSLTSVGTVTSGTWNGTTIAVANGGTGATSYTTNSIPYYDGTILNQNNADLSWNNGTTTLNLGSGISYAANAVTIVQGANPSGAGFSFSQTGSNGSNVTSGLSGSNGGSINITSGSGGTSSSTTTNARSGAGGTLSITAANAGDSTSPTSARPANGGSLSLTAGGGGNYAGSGTAVSTGAGGAITLTAGPSGGNIGTGTASNLGNGGDVQIFGGTGAFSNSLSSNGGNVYVAGASSSGGTANLAGNVILNSDKLTARGVTIIGTSSPLSAQLGVISVATNVPTEVIQAISGQTSDLVHWNTATPTTVAKVDASGNGTFASIIKTGGTSSQFLKADGSVDSSAYITGNQTITLSGDISGSGTTAITATLPNVNTNVGTFQGITVNAKGQVTAAANQSYLTGNQSISITGDGTGSGTTSIAFTLATVNSNTGSFGSSTSIPSFTVNGKGLITAASGNVVIAPAGTLSGTTLNSTIVTSSLTSLGTITSGIWNGTTIAIANGGTGTSSPGEVAGTGINLTGSFPTKTINSNAAYQISYQPGLLASVTTGKSTFHKVSAASTVDNLTASANRFTCTVNPVITFFECGTSTTCATPTTIGSATLTAANIAVAATVSSSSITAGDYVAWAVTAGTCTVLDPAASAQVHAN